MWASEGNIDRQLRCAYLALGFIKDDIHGLQLDHSGVHSECQLLTQGVQHLSSRYVAACTRLHAITAEKCNQDVWCTVVHCIWMEY